MLSGKILPWPLYRTLKRFREEAKAILSRRDLTALAQVYQTDKWGHHFYTPVYDHWFRDLRFKSIRLLEIGIGGYAKPRMEVIRYACGSIIFQKAL
jgi:hypothetical protein